MHTLRTTMLRLPSLLTLLWLGLLPTVAVAQDATTDTNQTTTPPQARDPLPSWDRLIEEISQIGAEVDLWRLVLAFLAILAGFSIRTYLLKRLLTPFAAIASKTETELDDQIIAQTERPLGWLINLLGFYLAATILQPPPGLLSGILLVLHTVGIVFVAWMLYNGVEVMSVALDRFTQSTESEMDDHLVPLVKKILRIAIIVTTLIMIIQQWGYDVTSLIAGLGLGGLAFALAAQSTLANFFGSIMIFTDRPFAVGDWIKTEHGEGVVEEIGLRSTKVRTFSKSLISIPNADIASSPVENFSQMNLRRIKTTIGLTYSTSPEQMEYVVEGIKRLILDEQGMFHESFYVNFVGFGGSSLDVLIYCFTETTAWGEYMDIRQRFYLNIMRLVAEAGSGFAFPSQSLYVETPIGHFEDPTSGAFAYPTEPEAVRTFSSQRRAPIKDGDGGMGDTNDGMSAEG